METLIETKSIPTLLLGILIILFAQVFHSIVTFLWGLKKKDDQARESTLKLVLSEQIKINKSINNCFYAIKSLAGPGRWEKISKEIIARNQDN